MQYYLSFLINGISLGVPIKEVQEIARPKSMLIKKKTGIKNLLGYFKLRGGQIPLYDLPRHLALEGSKRPEVIIINHGGITIGVLVDKVLGIVSSRDIVPYPDIIPQYSYLVGIVAHTEPLLQVVSLVKIFTSQRIKKIQHYMVKQAD